MAPARDLMQPRSISPFPEKPAPARMRPAAAGSGL